MIKFGNYVIRYNSSWLGVGESPTPPTPTLPSDMDFVYYANDFTGSYIPNSAPNSTFGNYIAQGTLYKNGSGVCDYDNGEEPCGSCGGSGQITSSNYCYECNGSGGQDVTCSTCGGTGSISNPNS